MPIRSATFGLVGLCVAVVVSPAGAEMTPHGGADTMVRDTTAGGSAAKTPSDAAFLDAMNKMMADMHKSVPTGDTDRDFVRLMIPHHQSAVDMAKAELQYGKDPELRALAQSIVADQQREIAMMRAWEEKHPK